MKRLLITGATGMIGSAIVRLAVEKNYIVCCIINTNTQRIKNIPVSSNVQIIECSMADYKSIALQEKYDVFIHLAWDKTFGSSRDDPDVQVKNIQYTIDAVRLAHRSGCSVFLGAGSQAEYGVVDKSITSDMPVNPESGYGIAKYAAGKLSALLCKQLGIRFNWVRILSIYGPLDAPHTLISYVINEFKNGRSPELTSCEQIWDYLYCDDAALALLAVAEKGKAGKVYPIGSGKGRKLYEYIEDIKNIINPEISVFYGKKEYYPYQPMYLVADISELTKDSGWKPKVSFIEGIKKINGC